jgi:hypothetical protein
MGATAPFLILACSLAAVQGGLTLLKSLARRRGTVGSALSGALASYEEAMRTTSHESHYELRAQTDRLAPALSPDAPRWTDSVRTTRS